MFFKKSFFPRPLFRMDLAQYIPNDAGILLCADTQVEPEYEKRARDSFVRGLVLGMGYGDEGKGKMIDALVEGADAAVRFQGGHNAGHTVKVGNQKFDLHIIPSSLVHADKEGIIARTCVLGVDLPKLRSRVEKDEDTSRVIWQMFDTFGNDSFVCNKPLEDILKIKKGTNEVMRGGLLPEIEQLASKGCPINGRLFIAEDTPMIGYHHILIDAFLEQARESRGLNPIGSTGTGISPAYSTVPLRNDVSIASALRNPDEYFRSMHAEWMPYAQYFPHISIDTLIEKQEDQIEKLRTFLNNGTIKIGDERAKIDELRKEKKSIVGEGAQAVLIGSGHSIYGTASMPDVSTFCQATGVTPEEIANIFPVLKLPPSSVGTRPLQFMQYVETVALAALRKKYEEFGVSTGRPRDIMKISLIEIAEAVRLILQGTPHALRERVVPVLNRVDGLSDFSTLTNKKIPIISGFSYERASLLEATKRETQMVGIHKPAKGKTPQITPKNLLKNYPGRSEWSSNYMFNILPSQTIERLVSGDFTVSSKKIGEAVHYAIQYILAAMFEGNTSREVILGTSPDRSGLILARDIAPYR